MARGKVGVLYACNTHYYPNCKMRHKEASNRKRPVGEPDGTQLRLQELSDIIPGGVEDAYRSQRREFGTDRDVIFPTAPGWQLPLLRRYSRLQGSISVAHRHQPFS